MLVLVEVGGALLGIILMLLGLFGSGSDSMFFIGLFVLIFSYITTSVGYCVNAKITESEYGPEHPKTRKAKIDAVSSIGRTTYVVGGTYKNVKDAAKYIGHPEHWDKV